MMMNRVLARRLCLFYSVLPKTRGTRSPPVQDISGGPDSSPMAYAGHGQQVAAPVARLSKSRIVWRLGLFKARFEER